MLCWGVLPTDDGQQDLFLGMDLCLLSDSFPIEF